MNPRASIVTAMGEILERWFSIPIDEGTDKVCTAKEAIERYVRPGMSIHIGCTHGRPYGLVYELVRRFWKKDPRFTVASLGFTGPMVALVQGGLVQKCIGTFFGDSYPTPGPNPVYQKAYRDRSVEFEHWSILTFPLRLKAAAMNLPGLPTRSLKGSSMEKDNSDHFRLVPDPFNKGQTMGMVAALKPDIALLHGWVADRSGNALFTPPYGEGFYGALASTHGLLLSVERIVPTDFIRRHSHLVRVPGFIVRSVSEIPMGSHPSGLSSQGIPEMEAYADDYAFIEDVRSASHDPAALEEWIGRWILEPQTQQEYLRLLGPDRILFLKGKARADSWLAETLGRGQAFDWSALPSPAERMIAAASEKMISIIRQKGYKNILAGVGAANLASWLAHRKLRDEGYDVEVMAEIGFYGFHPRPADPFIFNYRNMPTCKMLTDIETIMGHFVSGPSQKTLGAIGAGQIDRKGNVNSTLIPPHTLLVGSGGANDVASGAAEVVVILQQSRQRFLEKVPYITTPGDNVRTVVTDMGILEKPAGTEELVLTAIMLESDSGDGEAEKVRAIREACSWPLRVGEPLQRIPPPEAADLSLLRMYDPLSLFLA